MKHKHHIIPKHIGGSDEPSNLIELTVEEHAEVHRLLWEEYGRWQDYCAWLSLSKQITIQESIKLAQILGNLGKKHSQDHRKKITDSKVKNKTIKHKQLTKEKISKSLIGNKRAEGTKRSKEWIEKYKGSKSGKNNYMWGKTHNIESKIKISKSKQKPIMIDGKIFNSGLDAAKYFSVTPATISYWIKKGRAEFLYE